MHALQRERCTIQIGYGNMNNLCRSIISLPAFLSVNVLRLYIDFREDMKKGWTFQGAFRCTSYKNISCKVLPIKGSHGRFATVLHAESILKVILNINAIAEIQKWKDRRHVTA